MKRKTLWVILLAVVVFAAVVLSGIFFPHRGGYFMHNNYGMMGGFMFLGLIIPAGLLILIIAAGVWLGNKLSHNDHKNAGASAATVAAIPTCPNCSKTTASDWNTCPYCGTDLKKGQ